MSGSIEQTQEVLDKNAGQKYTILQGDTGGLGPGLGWLRIWMFHHPAWAVGSYTLAANQPGELNKY